MAHLQRIANIFDTVAAGEKIKQSMLNVEIVGQLTETQASRALELLSFKLNIIFKDVVDKKGSLAHFSKQYDFDHATLAAALAIIGEAALAKKLCYHVYIPSQELHDKYRSPELISADVFHQFQFGDFICPFWSKLYTVLDVYPGEKILESLNGRPFTMARGGAVNELINNLIDNKKTPLWIVKKLLALNKTELATRVALLSDTNKPVIPWPHTPNFSLVPSPSSSTSSVVADDAPDEQAIRFSTAMALACRSLGVDPEALNPVRIREFTLWAMRVTDGHPTQRLFNTVDEKGKPIFEVTRRGTHA